MGKHKHPEKVREFQELVADIRVAEAEAEKLKEEYNSKSAELLAKGREKIVEIRDHYEKKAADAKNKIISSERQKTEKMVNDILNESKKQASSLRSKKLAKKGLEEIFQAFIASL